MIRSYNPLSRQASAASGRSARYQAPLSSFVTRKRIPSTLEAPPAIPVQELLAAVPERVIDPGAAVPGRTLESVRDRTVDPITDAIEAAHAEGARARMGRQAGKKAAKVGVDVAVASLAGVPAEYMPDVIRGSLMTNPAIAMMGRLAEATMVERASERARQTTKDQFSDPNYGTVDEARRDLAGVLGDEAALERDDLARNVTNEEIARARRIGMMGPFRAGIYDVSHEDDISRQAYGSHATQRARQQMDASQMVDNPEATGLPSKYSMRTDPRFLRWARQEAPVSASHGPSDLDYSGWGERSRSNAATMGPNDFANQQDVSISDLEAAAQTMSGVNDFSMRGIDTSHAVDLGFFGGRSYGGGNMGVNDMGPGGGGGLGSGRGGDGRGQGGSRGGGRGDKGGGYR